MKKLFLSAISMMVATMNINAQVHLDTITEEGREKMNNAITGVYTTENEYAWWENANGETEYLRLHGLKPGLGVSCEYCEGRFTPRGSFSLELDGRGWWSKKSVVKDTIITPTGKVILPGTVVKDPVRIFSYELEVSFYQGIYANEAASAGKTYFAGDVMGYLKCQLYADKWQKVRINAILGVGVSYSRHDKVDDFGNWISPVDGDIYHLTDPIDHMALGLCGVAGIGVNIRMGEHSADRLEIRGLVGVKPNNTYHVTQIVPTYTVGIVYHKALREGGEQAGGRCVHHRQWFSRQDLLHQARYAEDERWRQVDIRRPRNRQGSACHRLLDIAKGRPHPHHP